MVRRAVCCKISDGILRGNGYVCKKTQVISDPDCEIVSIFRKVTDPEVVINSQDMEERYVLHDYDIEGFDYLPDDSTRMYRKEMLRIFGEKYAADYMLRR